MMSEYNTQELSNWFVKNYGLAMGIAFSRAPLPDQASDIVQTAYVEFLSEQINVFSHQELTNVLRRVIARVAQRYHDEKKRNSSQKMEDIAQYIRLVTQEKNQIANFDEELVALKKCIGKLTDRKKFIIEQYYFMNQTSRSLGEQFNISREAVVNAIFRIRRELKKCIRLLSEGRMKNG